MALLLYLLRDPVFATVTKPATGKVNISSSRLFEKLSATCTHCSIDARIQAADVLDYVPLVGKLFRFGTTAVLDYYHQFHFYTSAS